MRKLTIAPTNETLKINLDPDKNNLFFSGFSYPSDAIDFFQPVLEWIDEYLSLPVTSPISVGFAIEYINTSSLNYIFRILELLDTHHQEYKNVRLVWNYLNDDEDTLEAWKNLMSELNLPFEVIVHSTSDGKLRV